MPGSSTFTDGLNRSFGPADPPLQAQPPGFVPTPAEGHAVGQPPELRLAPEPADKIPQVSLAQRILDAGGK